MKQDNLIVTSVAWSSQGNLEPLFPTTRFNMNFCQSKKKKKGFRFTILFH